MKKNTLLCFLAAFFLVVLFFVQTLNGTSGAQPSFFGWKVSLDLYLALCAVEFLLPAASFFSAGLFFLFQDLHKKQKEKAKG